MQVPADLLVALAHRALEAAGPDARRKRELAAIRELVLTEEDWRESILMSKPASRTGRGSDTKAIRIARGPADRRPIRFSSKPSARLMALVLPECS